MGEVYEHWVREAFNTQRANTLIAQEVGKNVIREAFSTLRLIHLLSHARVILMNEEEHGVLNIDGSEGYRP